MATLENVRRGGGVRMNNNHPLLSIYHELGTIFTKVFRLLKYINALNP